METDILSELKKIRRERGSLSSKDLQEIGKKHDRSVAEMYSIATFYTETAPKVRGRYRINLCQSLPCGMKKMEDILQFLREELRIGPGGVTDDGMFSLHLVNCIGACDSAPAMLINETLYGDLTTGKVTNILEGLSKDQ
jgi:NADH-quinone oxidoreductase subunit E